MQRTNSRISIAVGMMMGLAVASPVLAGGRTLTIKTPSLAPEPAGYLLCTVVATGSGPISLTATVRQDDGSNVTDFGTSFRASPDVTGDGYLAEETAGSLVDGARYCRVTADGTQRRNIQITLTAYDANGAPGASVSAR